MSPAIKAILISLFFSSVAFADPVYSCYTGKVSFKGLNFNEVRLKFSDDSSNPYVIIFSDGKRKAGTDMACSKGIVGMCGLTDTSGRLKVSQFDSESVTFRFDGAPSIVKRPDSDWPFVDPKKPDPGIGSVVLKRDKDLSHCSF